MRKKFPHLLGSRTYLKSSNPSLSGKILSPAQVKRIFPNGSFEVLLLQPVSTNWNYFQTNKSRMKKDINSKMPPFESP